MSADYCEFPKLLWSADGVEVTVCDAVEEAEKLAAGYRLTAEAPVVAPPAELPEPDPEPEDDGPTFGGPQDDSFGADAKAKKGGKKK